MNYLSVKNFEKFQHYKNRNPPWIKLYFDLLDDYEFLQLPDATKWHLVASFLLASRHSNKIPADKEWIKGRIRATAKINFNLLKEAGFLTEHVANKGVKGDSKEIAGDKQKIFRSVSLSDSISRSIIDKELIQKVVDLLNQKTGGKFLPDTETTIKLICHWAGKGHGFEDFETVIEKKCAEWKGNIKMERQLKPPVLFGKTHFKDYLEEPWPYSKKKPAKEIKIKKVEPPLGVDLVQSGKWALCMFEIEAQILPDNFKSLFETMAFGGVTDGKASLICADDFHADCMAKNYTDLIEMTLTEVFGKPVSTDFVIEKNENPEA